MNARQPFATIIVPTYNQEAFLGQALESLLAQTDSDWEAIIVNDGSTDRTAEIAEEYARRDSRIRCIHKPNGGVASALNTGLKNARGEWIHWLSSDDMFEPDKLAVNRRWIGQYPEHNFFFSYFTLLRETTGIRERRGLWGPLPDLEHQILTLFYRNYVSGISICIRRSAWEAAGFFDESLHYAQDYDQWLRLLQQNQAVFIPEWTVISRNHAAQGSETFPEACYFDTAKAAIRFINRHPFPQLVPWADLSNTDSATKAVSYALEIASDRTAFLYCLGPHPALIIRVLEWVCSEHCSNPDLIGLVRSRIAEMSFVDGDDDWAWMWRQLTTAIHGGRKQLEFTYSSIDTKQLALREYQSRRIRNPSTSKVLGDYLVRFEGADPDKELPSAESNRRIVLMFDRTLFDDRNLFAALTSLARRGFRPVWLINDATAGSAMEWHDWVPAIRMARFDRDTLPWLGDAEHVITQGGDSHFTWFASLSHTELTGEYSSSEIAERLLIALGCDEQKQVRPIVFLERVLWGGGAERVVLDIVRHLNRQCYRPVVVTMFDVHASATELPQDVEFFNVNKVDIVNKTNSTARWLRRIYYRLLNPDTREKISLGHKLRVIKHRVYALFSRRDQRGPRSSEQVGGHNVVDRQGLDFDFISAMTHHNPTAIGLARIMSKLGENVALVAIMEEAAVTAWLAQAAVRFPYVVSLHSFESACMRDIYQSPSRLAAEWKLLATASNEAEMVTFPSQGCCHDLKDNFAVSRANIRTIWNPVDCASIRRLSFQRMEAVEQWQNKAQCFRMVHVGRLDPQKNHDLLLSACAELKERRRDFSLVIAGEGRDRPNIEKRIKMLGLDDHVRLVGEQKNPFPWVAAANALLLTSRFEAFALVLVEAMVCGTPVVSVNCPAGPAEVLDNGKFGLLVPNDDPVSFADAIERLMDDALLAQRLIELGYERAIEFDVKKIVPLWEELIDSLPSGQVHSPAQ